MDESGQTMNEYAGLVQGKVHDRREISEYYCGGCGWPVTDHDSYCRECGGALHKGMAESRWHELFGTPEKAAWTVLQLLDCCNTHCEYCGVRTLCDASQVVDGKDGMVEWLRDDA